MVQTSPRYKFFPKYYKNNYIASFKMSKPFTIKKNYNEYSKSTEAKNVISEKCKRTQDIWDKFGELYLRQ